MRTGDLDAGARSNTIAGGGQRLAVSLPAVLRTRRGIGGRGRRVQRSTAGSSRAVRSRAVAQTAAALEPSRVKNDHGIGGRVDDLLARADAPDAAAARVGVG